MSKITNRVLSAVLAVLMVVSMVSVFTVPVAAAAVDATDYDAAFETAFIINKDWSDDQLVGTDDLTIAFRGKTKTVNPTTHKLYNSYDEAFADAYADGNVTVDNYFTYMPIFVFGPGDYSADGEIHVPTPAYIWGTNAGISPNAEVDPTQRDIAWIQANGGWPKNDARSDNETILGRVCFSTRGYNEEAATWNVEQLSGDGAVWQYLLDKALAADADASVDLYVDGIKNADKIFLTTTDVGRTYSYGTETSLTPVTRDRNSTIYIKNVTSGHTSAIMEAWNTTWFDQSVVLENYRTTANVSAIGNRFIDTYTVRNSYFANTTTNGFLFEPWVGETSSIRRTAATLNVEECVFYALGNMPFYLNGDNMHKSMKSFTFNMTNSLLFNAGKATWGYFRVDNNNTNSGTLGANASADRELMLNIQNNIIYDDQNVNTMFNGNANYITDGKTTVKFNGNRVVSPTLAAIPPNSPYAIDVANDILDYDFSGNFFGTAVDAVGKEVVFGANGSPVGASSASTWAWDWAGNNSYYDYDMLYHTSGTEIASVDVGTAAQATVSGTTIVIDAPNGGNVLTAASFATVDTNAVVELSATSDFAQTLESIDLNAVEGVATYYAKAYYDGALKDASTKLYEISVIKTEPTNFNEALDNGVTIYGRTFTTVDTAIVPGADIVVSNGAFYAWLDGVFYKFEIDNQNVFEAKTSTVAYTQALANNAAKSASGYTFDHVKAVAEGKNILLVGTDFTQPLLVTYPTTFYGANAGVNPVDKTTATPDNQYKASISADWDEVSATKVGEIHFIADVVGQVKFDGITVTKSVIDNYRAGTSADAIDITFENIVVEGTGFSGTAIYMGRNPRNTNSTDAELGKELDDKLTLRNFYIKTAKTNQILDEFSPQTLVLDNVFCDITASTRNRDIIAFMKSGALNMNFNATIKNSIITNGGKHDNVVNFGGNTVKTNFTEGDGHDFSVTVTNNIFYKTGAVSVISLAAGALNRITVTENTAVAYASGSTLISCDNNNVPAGATVPVADNFTVSGNKAIGFEGLLIADMKMGDKNPEYVDGFYALDEAALSDTTGGYGMYHDDMGENRWYIDAALTNEGEWFFIESMTSDVDGIGNFVINNNNATLSFDLYAGSTADITVNLLDEYADYYWSTDAAGENRVDSIANSDFEDLVEIRYLNVTQGDVVRTYEATITAGDPLVFTEDYEFVDGYFGKGAVLVTDKAANAATGTVIYEQWQGEYYAFTVGVNAVAEYDDTTAAEVLVKEWGSAFDFTAERSVKVYTENFNVSPYTTDGYGKDSPSHGTEWAYNEAYTANMVSMRHLIIPGSFMGSVELYGFNLTGNVKDTARASGNTLSLHMENVMFTGENLNNLTSGSTSYLFFTSGNSQLTKNTAQKDTLTVKNMFVNITNGNTARLIGEPVYETTEFDGLFVDAAKSGFNEWNAYLKHQCENGNFTIKNSALLNLSGDKGIVFQAKYDTAGSSAANDLAEGLTNTITLENNIITGAFGGTQNANSDAFLNIYANGYSAITVKDNYLAAQSADTASMELFWAYGINAGNMDKLNCAITVTGNIMNGFKNDFRLQASNASNRGKLFTWTINDNLLTEYTEDISTAIGKRPIFFTEELIKMSGDTGYGILAEAPTFLLDAAGKLATNEIYDMTPAAGVVLDGTTETITVPMSVIEWEDVSKEPAAGEEKVYTYKFNPGKIFDNPYSNYIEYTIGDVTYTDYDNSVTVTSDTELTSLEFAAAIYSPDGTVSGDTATIKIINHTMTKHAGTPATCTEGGIKDYFECTTCEKLFADEAGNTEITDLEAWLATDAVVGALGHDMVEVAEVSATCTEDGVSAHKACSRCDLTEGKTTITKLGHNMEDVAEVAPTCTTPGTTAHKACSRCDHTEGKEEIAVVAHVYTAYAANNDATCTANGTETASCDFGCGTKNTREIAESALGHDLKDIPEVGATCTTPGTTAHKDCTRCDYTENKAEIAVVAHVYTDYMANNDATCTENGTETASCDFGCGTENTREVAESALGHDLADIPEVGATCQTAGTTAHKACTRCDHTEDKAEIAIVAHKYTNYLADKEATCTANATEIASCDFGCGTTNTIEIAETALGHDMVDVAELAPTCQTAGTTAHKACSRCDHTEGKAEIAVVAHKYTTYVDDKAATCTENATKAASCDFGCGTKNIVEVENTKLGHNMADVAELAPTCQTAGTTAHKACSRCDHTEGKTAIAALGHDLKDVAEVPATETEDGVTAHKACSRCDHTEGKEVIPATGKQVEIVDTTKVFGDVKAKKWYTNAINYAYSHGFIAGLTETEYGINEPITRGQFITILARIAGVKTNNAANKAATTRFTDVKVGKFYTAAIAWASENGVVNGVTDTEFAPDAAIERQQLCVMIVNFAKYMGIELTASEDAITFADATSIYKYARKAVATCQQADIVNGYNENGGVIFKPTATATRAEAAQILYKFHKDFVAK